MNRLHLIVVTMLLLVACAPVALTHALVTETNDFIVEAQPLEGKQRPTVEGYIHNKRPMLATRLRLRVESLDTAGAVVATVVQPYDQVIQYGDRAYFEVPAASAAPAYRVTVDYVFWRVGGVL